MTTVAITILLSGVLIFLLSLPMIYRKVPMNHFYGVRIPAAFESDRRWYGINAYGGRLMAIASLPIMGAGVTGLFLPSDWLLPYAWAASILTLASLLVPFILVLRWSCLKGPN
ncbi:MAG: SdpI family protein [Verrucomicrobia bacterium]|nr:SdpI family protein [Verrucomicrobiota bacterium]